MCREHPVRHTISSVSGSTQLTGPINESEETRLLLSTSVLWRSREYSFEPALADLIGNSLPADGYDIAKRFSFHSQAALRIAHTLAVGC